METKKADFNNLNRKLITEIVDIIKNGGVIAMPTDTVYGLVCDATNKEAVRKIFEIKKREESKPISIFINSIKMARKYVKIEKAQEECLKTGDTCIFSSKERMSLNRTLGIRLPKSELIMQIIKKLKVPLAQTSANISGQLPINNIREINLLFKKQETQPDLIIDAGNLLEHKASKVIDLTSDEPKIIRE